MNRRLEPPSDLLSVIGGEGHWIEFLFPTIDIHKSLFGHVAAMVYIAIREYYLLGLRSTFFLSRVTKVYVEMLENAMEHGNGGDKSKLVTVLLSLGPQGVLLGIQDEGPFFRYLENKQKLEDRVVIPSGRSPEEMGGYGLPNYLYRHADHIYVSVDQHALFYVTLR